jgi:hypothetical protein
MLVSLGFMLLLSQFTWTEIVDGAPVVRKLHWPWFTLIGTTVTILIAAAVRALLPAPKTIPAGASPKG